MRSCAIRDGHRSSRHSLTRWKRAFWQGRFTRTDRFERTNRPYLIGIEAAFFTRVRTIKLTGREASVLRAIGFTESMLGSEIRDFTRMESQDITDTLNALLAA